MKNINNEIILKIKNGDHNSFRYFYLQTVDLFFRWIKTNYNIWNNDIKDILSDFYLKIRTNRKYLPQDWYKNRIRLVFKNNLKDRFKKKKITHFTSLNNDWNDFSFEENIKDEENDNLLELIDKDFKLEEIKRAIKKLDETSQELIFLKFIENKTYSEISEILWYKEDMIRQRISRAIKKLRNILYKR